MAVPGSGQLKLWNSIWNAEIGGAQGNNSLHSASVYAGFTTPDAMSDFYGWSDVEVPSVSTQGVTSVEQTSQTLNGNVSATGNENRTRGFYFGTNSAAAVNNTKYSLGVGGVGTFSSNRTGLSSNTTYYNWAFACNSAGEAQGDRTQAATQAPPFTPTFSDAGSAFTCQCVCVGGCTSGGTYSFAYVTAGYNNIYTGGGNTLTSQNRACLGLGYGQNSPASLVSEINGSGLADCFATNTRNYRNTYGTITSKCAISAGHYHYYSGFPINSATVPPWGTTGSTYIRARRTQGQPGDGYNDFNRSQNVTTTWCMGS